MITGGAGYVGSVLVRSLLEKGYHVKVLDLLIYGKNVFEDYQENPNLEIIKGDIRNESLLKRILPGCDAVIHLACISNDPSYELNPALSKTINFDAFEPLVNTSKASGVRRFIYASSASVYGISDIPEVTEEHPLVPLTDYNKYKGMCEPILHDQCSSNFSTIIIRPATVCGYSPRQRFDLSVNILTNHAVNTGKITVFGGKQKRPNLHIKDMVDLYVMLMEETDEKVSGKTYNIGYQNFTISEIAEIVRSTVTKEMKELDKLEIVTRPSNDIRSYHISSKKIQQELGFIPKYKIEDAVKDLCSAFKVNKFSDSINNPLYFNIKRMQELNFN